MSGDNFGDGCILPFLQSLATGLLVGGFVFALGYLMGWDPTRAAMTGLLVGSLAALIVWLSGISFWRRVTTWDYLPADPAPIETEQQPARPHIEHVRVLVTSEDGRQGDLLRLPVDSRRLSIMAQKILTGTATFSLGSLTGSGKLFTRREYETLRDEFINRGALTWVNPRAHEQGTEFTAAGRAVLRTFASMGAGHPPTLQEPHACDE